MKRLCVGRNGVVFNLPMPLYTLPILLAFLLFNVAACTKKHVAAPLSGSTDSLSYLTDTSGYSTPSNLTGYTLVWHDEFDGNGIDTASWNFETGNGPGGWGNNELEYYTASHANVFTAKGKIVLEARKEEKNGFQYTSARINTKNKRAFTYGRVDIRAKLPFGKGIWPALWMLGQSDDSVGWPACGEIDIMELLGQKPNKVYGTLHWGAEWPVHVSKGRSYSFNGSFSNQFHVFSLSWEKDSYKILVDDKAFFSATGADIAPYNNPFTKPHYFIFNVAVGGNWPGSPDTATVFPQRMIVDYIRVFQK
ncbi:MAG TPA: glycoside hydrolase family 16 protein [Niastella sp.]|nr:glycoside hydrolase family 16 protein [Niastella sp.]